MQYSNARAGGAAQQQLATMNALQLEQDAANARLEAQAAGRITRQQGQSIRGTQRALFASSGVVTGTGSALEVDIDTAAQIELQALMQERAGAIESLRLRRQAANSQTEGRFAKAAANNQAIATVAQGINRIYGYTTNYNYVAPQG